MSVKYPDYQSILPILQESGLSPEICHLVERHILVCDREPREFARMIKFCPLPNSERDGQFFHHFYDSLPPSCSDLLWFLVMQDSDGHVNRLKQIPYPPEKTTRAYKILENRGWLVEGKIPPVLEKLIRDYCSKIKGIVDAFHKDQKTQDLIVNWLGCTSSD